MGGFERIQEVNKSCEEQLDVFLVQSRNLLVSGEDMSLLDKRPLKDLMRKITNHGYKIHAIALIRSPCSLLWSALLEIIKLGQYHALISFNDSACSGGKRQFGSTKIVKKTKNFFLRSMSFYSFWHACLHLFGPAGYLFQVCHKFDPAVFNYVKTNQFFFRLTLRMKNELYRVNPAFDGQQNLNSKHQRLPPMINKIFYFSGKFLLTHHEYSLEESSTRREEDDLKKLLVWRN